MRTSWLVVYVWRTNHFCLYMIVIIIRRVSWCHSRGSLHSLVPVSHTVSTGVHMLHACGCGCCVGRTTYLILR